MEISEAATLIATGGAVLQQETWNKMTPDERTALALRALEKPSARFKITRHSIVSFLDNDPATEEMNKVAETHILLESKIIEDGKFIICLWGETNV